jgi:hypothetical protein
MGFRCASTALTANLNPQTVAIKEIALDNAYARVVIETNHVINLLAALRPANTNAPAATNRSVAVKKRTATIPQPRPRRCRISPLITLSFPMPRSVSPTARSRRMCIWPFQQAGGTIAGISSEELQHADVKLHAAVDGVGPVSHHRPDQSVQRHPDEPFAGFGEGRGFDTDESLRGEVCRLPHRHGQTEHGPGVQSGRAKIAVEECHHAWTSSLSAKG